MNWAARIAITALCLLGVPAFAADDQPPQWTIGPCADWILATTNIPSVNRIPSKDSAGQAYLLYEEQIHTELQQTYWHMVKAILSSTGVQHGSSVSVDFDPAYQRLVLHNVRILRGDRAINQLEAARVKIIQRERDLDRHVYDGDVSAVIFLEDVRVGDKIEYDYTVSGFNPVLKNKFARVFALQWGVPVALQSYRVVSSPRRKLHFRLRNNAPAPTKLDTGDMRELRWTVADMPASDLEDSVPSWFDPEPAIELSEFETWRDVAEWAVGVYSKPRSLPAELVEKIAEWKKTSATPQDLAAKALQFVQDEVRYLGIESGIHSHEPTDPQIVCSRRFGDCKDKTVLLCTILESMGLKAYPVAVNDWWRQGIADWQPTPFAFNHIVVQMTCGTRIYWMDPTDHLQRGGLDDRYFRNFGYGLVINSATTNLTKIPSYQTGIPHRTVYETFHFLNTNGLVDMTVKTVVRGSEADDLRQQLANSTLSETEKSYLDYYAGFYPSIQQVGHLQIKEDTTNNTIETSESYRIINIWKTSADTNSLSCTFDARTINDVVKIPKHDSRKMPLKVRHPVYREHHTRIFLAEDWELKDESKTISNEAFNFSYTLHYRKKYVDIDYDYRSLRDVVEPAKFPAYFKAISMVDDTLQLPIQKPNLTAANTPNWPLILLAMCFGGVLTVVSFWMYRLPKPATATPVETVQTHLSGLSGWLAVLGFGLVVKFFYSLNALSKYWQVFALETWHRNADPSGSAYHYLWGPAIVFQAVAFFSLPVTSAVLLFFYFSKHRLFPRLCIIIMWFHAVLVIALYGLIVAIGNSDHSPKYVIQAFGACMLWSLYLTKSKRVRATFVE